MADHMSTHLDRRLRAARPQTAVADEHAFDAGLLARVRDQPIAARRAVPRVLAAPVVAGVSLTVAGAVMLGGGPDNVGGPAPAFAVDQTLHWLNPPDGTILHVRSIETQGARTTTRELWQSADDVTAARERIEETETYETAGNERYDPATNTIYDVPGATTPDFRPTKGKTDEVIPGDPIVYKVRKLLQDGHMEVKGRGSHNGTDAWAISLKPDAGRPVWTLWVSADDGKPLELRDPGRDASEQPQVIRWSTYEALPGGDAEKLLTLEGAHPSARVVHEPAPVPAPK
jgi:hypothetical protein